MDRRWKGSAFAGAGLVLCLSCGCVRVTMTATAATSRIPVMFGPAKSLDAGAATRESPRAARRTPFHHEETARDLIVCLGWATCEGFPMASTNPIRDEEIQVSSGMITRADRDWLDRRVREGTGDDPSRRVDLTSVRCGGFGSFFFLFGDVIRSHCEMDGFVSTAQ